jgi:hypothetical protein
MAPAVWFTAFRTAHNRIGEVPWATPARPFGSEELSELTCSSFGSL